MSGGKEKTLLKKGFSPSPRAPILFPKTFIRGGEKRIGAMVAVGRSPQRWAGRNGLPGLRMVSFFGGHIHKKEAPGKTEPL